jgi:putative addiction module component (TIGR02574 family)
MNYNIHSLTIDEKIKLAEELWKSIETERAASLSPAQQQLLQKRIMLHQQNPEKGRTWKEIKRKYFD